MCLVWVSTAQKQDAHGEQEALKTPQVLNLYTNLDLNVRKKKHKMWNQVPCLIHFDIF